jgi:membrane protein DedA with SNARE-associated domain
MDPVLEFVGRYGTSVVFLVVFLDQLGLPIPTVPVLMALGALAGVGRIDPLVGLLVAIVACLCADTLWFQLGRRKGTRVLGWFCRIALEPDTCVSKTHDLFSRYGVRSLLFAKFVPGYDTVAPPLAGLMGVPVRSFLLWSAGGALLWSGAFGGLGYLFSDSIEALAVAAERFGWTVLAILAGLCALYLAWKYTARQRVLRSIRMARITPQELHELILGGQEPMILDARSRGAIQAMPYAIEGAQPLLLEDVDARQLEIALQREVVVYCS